MSFRETAQLSEHFRSSRPARGRTGQKPKLGPRQVELAPQLHEETGADGKWCYIVA